MLLGLAQLWDGAIVLARWLQRQIAAGSGSAGCDRTVLELGSGTGLVGISAAVLCGARVLLTDRDAVFTVTQLNAERNRGGVEAAGGVLCCAELDWLVAAPPEDDEMVWGSFGEGRPPPLAAGVVPTPPPAATGGGGWGGWDFIVGSDILYDARMCASPSPLGCLSLHASNANM